MFVFFCAKEWKGYVQFHPKLDEKDNKSSFIPKHLPPNPFHTKFNPKSLSSEHSFIQQHLHTKPFHPKLHPTNDLCSRYAPIKIPKIDILQSALGRSCPRFKKWFVSSGPKKNSGTKTIISHPECFVCTHPRLSSNQ